MKSGGSVWEREKAGGLGPVSIVFNTLNAGIPVPGIPYDWFLGSCVFCAPLDQCIGRYID